MSHDRNWTQEWGRPPVSGNTMRVSDAERAEVANALCRHFGDGRLDDEELNERLARANAAKTRADLTPLLADLPRFHPTAAPPPGAGRRHRGGIMFAVVIVLIVAWSAAGAAATFLHPHVPWLLIAILGFFFLRRHRWRETRVM